MYASISSHSFGAWISGTKNDCCSHKVQLDQLAYVWHLVTSQTSSLNFTAVPFCYSSSHLFPSLPLPQFSQSSVLLGFSRISQNRIIFSISIVLSPPMNCTVSWWQVSGNCEDCYYCCEFRHHCFSFPSHSHLDPPLQSIPCQETKIQRKNSLEAYTFLSLSFLFFPFLSLSFLWILLGSATQMLELLEVRLLTRFVRLPIPGSQQLMPQWLINLHVECAQFPSPISDSEIPIFLSFISFHHPFIILLSNFFYAFLCTCAKDVGNECTPDGLWTW